MDRIFQLSSYQQDIVDFVKFQKGNLLVDAKAGSGKTSTLIMLADELTKCGNKCLFLSFNKHIVEELKEKVSDTENCTIKTVHSLGQSFIYSHLYRKHGKKYKLTVNTLKLRELVRAYYDEYFRTRIDTYNALGVWRQEDVERIKDSSSSELDLDNVKHLDDRGLKQLHNDLITDFVGLCNFSRLYNRNYRCKGELSDLVRKFCWKLSDYVFDALEDYQDLVIAVLDKTKELFENPEMDANGDYIYEIDFTDMIYFPVYYNMTVPASIKQYLGTVLCDECQDLSVLQQKFIRKLDLNFNRFIFVGDKFQSIYAFAGADVHAVDELKQTFILKQLPLNICYRCPENVIRLAQSIVPTIEWNIKREDKGVVEFVTMEDAMKNLKPKDVLIGRKNKELVQIYRKFVLSMKKSVKFRNKELVNQLVNNIEQVITNYINRYVRGLNVEQPLEKHMIEFMKDTGELRDSDLYKTEYESYRKKLISDNSGKSSRISKSNNSIDYLQKCMKEFKGLGAFGEISEDDEKLNDLTEFYSIIDDFLKEYKKISKRLLIDDFKSYITEFLSGNMDKDVPIIGSVHSMKGGEADNIYIYNYPMFPYKMPRATEDEEQQEINLKYVAITRAKKNLYLIECDESEDMDGHIKVLNAESKSEVNYLLNPEDYKKALFSSFESD